MPNMSMSTAEIKLVRRLLQKEKVDVKKHESNANYLIMLEDLDERLGKRVK